MPTVSCSSLPSVARYAADSTSLCTGRNNQLHRQSLRQSAFKSARRLRRLYSASRRRSVGLPACSGCRRRTYGCHGSSARQRPSAVDGAAALSLSSSRSSCSAIRPFASYLQCRRAPPLQARQLGKHGGNTQNTAPRASHRQTRRPRRHNTPPQTLPSLRPYKPIQLGQNTEDQCNNYMNDILLLIADQISYSFILLFGTNY